MNESDSTINSKAWKDKNEVIRRLYDSWSQERGESVKRRRIRRIDIDNETLRSRGDIAADESFVAIRLIDSNIAKEKPVFVNYLKQSHRQAVFSPIDGVHDNVGVLEEYYTRGMSYMRWEMPHIKAQDGAAVHGWDAVEIVFDESKPFGIKAEHVGHDKLWFNQDVEDIQDSAFIGRDIVVSKKKLKSWVDSFGFSAEEIKRIITKDDEQNQDQGATIVISKLWFRDVDGIVQVTYWHRDARNWLRPVMPAVVGLVDEVGNPETITKYPIILLKYFETEEPEIVSSVGRVWLDRYKQEAVCTLWSSAVTASTRSANLYASPANPTDVSTIAPLQGLQLEGNTMYNQPISFHSPPPPSSSLVDFAQKLEVQNDQEIGQVNFALQGRKDTKSKTATEVEAADENQAQLSSVPLVYFANYLREFHNSCWVIVQSRLMAGLLTNVPPTLTPDIVTKSYLIQPSGDVDVIKRQQKERVMRQDWAVVGQTPLSTDFLVDMIKTSYPNDWQRYEQILRSGQAKNDQAKQLVTALMQVIEATVDQDDIKGTPNLANNLEKIKSTAQAFLEQP